MKEEDNGTENRAPRVILWANPETAAIVRQLTILKSVETGEIWTMRRFIDHHFETLAQETTEGLPELIRE